MNRHSWSIEQDEAILRLVRGYGVEDWTRIALELKNTAIERTGKQCRERWYNHLSPLVNKKPWTADEELKLFDLHRQYGNRWKDISKCFVGRTDNDIKNHFYSTLRRSLRRLNKLLGKKNSTSHMRQIKPTVLSKIMHCMYQLEKTSSSKCIHTPIRDFPRLVFSFATLKPLKITQSQDEKVKIAQIFQLVTKFNQEYEDNKKKFVSQEKANSQLTGEKAAIVDDSRKQYKTTTSLEETKESQQEVGRQIEQQSFAQIQEEVLLQRKRRISLQQDEMLSMDFQDPEQPSCEFIVVGKKLEMRRWEMSMDQVSEEIL